MTKFSLFSVTLLATAVSAAVQANEAEVRRFDRLGPSQSNFGGVGLMQMPTARMARTGEFSANYMDNDQYRRWSLSVQPFDWLETTLRYTDVRTKLYSQYPGFSGDQTYKDKGMDFKLRLWQESRWLPTVAVGARDLTGTGLFDSEFVVASKRWGDLDFTLGMAWGNMGESGNIKNPFCSVADDWCIRDSSFSGRGGQFEFGKMFHGPAALFGGIEYQTPWQPLRLKLEYDGNDYSNESAGKIEQNSPLNVGAVYRVSDALDTQLSYQRGNTLMWGVTLRTNFTDMQPSWQVAPVQPSRDAAQPSAAVNSEALAQDLRVQAGFQAVEIRKDSDRGSVQVQGEQAKYRDHRLADERAAALVQAHLADEQLKTLEIAYQREHMTVETNRIDLEAWRAQQDPQLGESQPTYYKAKVATARASGDMVARGEAERWSWGWKPQLQQSWGGPESFYLYQFGINGDSDVWLSDHLKLGGTLYWNWFDNFDKFNYTAPPQDTGAIPRVRTWIREYVTSSDLLLNNLQLTALDQLAPDWYGQAYGGYLEMMYAGIGSELLYRPNGQRWALGADVNYVRQRDWTNTLKLADYTTTTGHVTAYIDVPWVESTQAKISVGRYLAQDVGATVDLSRRFESGVIVGAFATFTDVSAEEYGEGSFSKGIYFTIPFDLLLSQPTTRVGGIGWNSLTRDGGQMLGRRYSLFTLTEQHP